MEFVMISTIKASVSSHQMRELLRLFNQWQPPTTMKALYFATDTKHAFAGLEADNAAQLSEVTSTFADYLDFQIFPVMQPQEGAEILGRMQTWVDQVKG